MEVPKAYWSTLYFLLNLLLLLVVQVASVQHFLEKPDDTAVIAGQMVRLNCKVAEKAGSLQWTKDGYAMGFDRDIPGYPRYSMVGSESLGEYDLLIQRTTLEDDARFECQVGLRPGHPALAAGAHLEIHIPPKLPEIEGFPNGTLVEVPHEQETVNLTCESKEGKPAATIKWFRNGEEITEAIQYFTEDAGSKLLNAKSILTITPKEDDNGAFFTCSATNSASEGMKLETTVGLSVMHPPNPPTIKGYKTGTVVKTGESLMLECKSEGGNPAPQVHWYKNDMELDFSYQTGDGEAVNELTFTIQPNDNEAVYRCEAKNRVTPKPLTAEVKLTVQFGPERVEMTGNKHAKAGETITLTCKTEISNPPAKITWYGRGQAIPAESHITAPSPQGGFITTSNITVELTDLSNNMLYSCHAFNDALGKTETATMTLSVMYPPGEPVISGYNEGKEIEEGNVLTMTCQSHGGNPLATLTWWKDGQEIEGVTRINDRIVTNRISFILEPEDNKMKYRCNATNPATTEPLLTYVTLTVNYPPKSLELTTDPVKPKAGQPLTIKCTSGSSNPESALSWWKDGLRLAQGEHVKTVDADFGGKSTVSQLSMTPTADDDGQIYECRATNMLLERAVVDAIALDVSYMPVFPPDSQGVFAITEGTAGILNLTAIGNPPPISYTWYKDGEKITWDEKKSKRDVSIPHFVSDGGVLNITNVTRKDAGMYSCEASNTEGATKFDVKLDVQYPAGITKVTDSVIVDQNSVAVLECHVDANPLPEKVISWSRDGYNMSRTVQEFSPGKSELVVRNVTKDDSGTFTCTAANGVKEAATAEAKLVVKYAPEIDRAQRYSKAAARSMETGTLLCKAEGAPKVTFTWYKENQVLDISGVRYNEETTQDGIVQYTSSLQVFNVTLKDYGFYKCRAKNDLGMDTHTIHLDDTSEPESPYDISYVNTTHNSVALSWEPGFNGGAPQRFRIRYRRVGSEGYKTEEVTPRNATVFVVTGLTRATDYEFSVQGENDFGASPFQPKFITVRTAAVAAMSKGASDDVTLIIILTVSIFGMILVGLNILLILFFYRKRKKKMEKDASEGASNANTVEMFSAPTITEDSKSYTTFDHRSIDDYPDDYRIYDPDDELKRFLPPPTYSSTDLYRPPSSHMYGPPPHLGPAPPHLGSAPHLAPGVYGTAPRHNPSPAFEPQRSYPGGPQLWDNRKYDPYGSMPRVPPAGMQDDTPEEYANQIRALTKSISNPDDYQPRDQGPSSLPPMRPPPVPPTRSSSKPHLAVDGPQSMPPLPSRNYDDMHPPPSSAAPRYVPPPGRSQNSPARSSPSLRKLQPSNLKGRLV